MAAVFKPGQGLVVTPSGGLPSTYPAMVVLDPATGDPVSPGDGSASTTADGANVALGARADAAATTDTGTFSVIAFIKRGLQNWTTLLARIPALSTGAVPVETIKQPLVARQLAAAVANADTTLTSTTRRISIYARGGDVRYAIGSTAQTASATTHFIAQGERLDVAVPATPHIAVIRGGAADCTLELSELA